MKKTIIALTVLAASFATQAAPLQPSEIRAVVQTSVLFQHCADYTAKSNEALSSAYKTSADRLNTELSELQAEWQRDLISFETKRANRGHKRYSRNVLRRSCLQHTEWVS